MLFPISPSLVEKVTMGLSRNKSNPLPVTTQKIGIGREAVASPIVVGNAVMDVVQPLRCCSYPQRMTAIHEQSICADGGAFKSRDHIANLFLVRVGTHA
jgi:hypothetical protein